MTHKGKIVVAWEGTGRRPQDAPNPAYPLGLDLDVAAGQKSCRTNLPYPAESVGHYVVHCQTCGRILVVTAASRPDDPRSVRIPCKITH